MGLEQIKVELLSSWQGPAGGDGTVAHAAWASSIDQEKLSTKSDDDIRRLATNVVTMHHDTPKERLWMEFFLTVPIFVERQFDKYRMTLQYQDFQVEFLERPMGGDHITQNELSGRYRTLPERYYALPNDVDDICGKAVGVDGFHHWNTNWTAIMQGQHDEYRERLDILKAAEKAGKITNSEYKRAREVWRGLCGTATLTDMRIVMNLNAFEHIICQRIPKEAQLESRAVAYLMVKTILDAKVAPTTISKMIEVNGWAKYMEEIALAIENENRGIISAAPILTPEDSLWFEILKANKELNGMQSDEARDILVAGGFPIHIIDWYLTNWHGCYPAGLD